MQSCRIRAQQYNKLLHFHDCEQSPVENTFCGIPTGPLRDLALGFFVLTPEALYQKPNRPFTVAKVKRSPVDGSKISTHDGSF